MIIIDNFSLFYPLSTEIKSTKTKEKLNLQPPVKLKYKCHFQLLNSCSTNGHVMLNPAEWAHHIVENTLDKITLEPNIWASSWVRHIRLCPCSVLHRIHRVTVGSEWPWLMSCQFCQLGWSRKAKGKRGHFRFKAFWWRTHGKNENCDFRVPLNKKLNGYKFHSTLQNS